MILVKTKRLDYLDRTKGFAILLVVLGHIYVDNNFKTWLYSFHMPLFFMISGMLNFYKYRGLDSLSHTFIKKIKSIMIPYLFLSCISVFSEFLFSGCLLDRLLWDIKYTIVLYGVGPVWFLAALFLVEISFSFILNLSKSRICLILISGLVLISAIFIRELSKDFYVLIMARCLFGLFFYIIGYCSFKFINRINISLVFIFILFICSWILSLWNSRVDLWELKLENIYLYVINSILGSFIVTLFFKKIKFNLLSYFGRNSMIIMGTHVVILKFISSFLVYDWNNYILGGLLFILTMLIEIAIIRLINNKLPFLIGKSKVSYRYQ